MTAPSLIDATQSETSSPVGTRSLDFNDDDVQALAGWLVELPHIERVLAEVHSRRPQLRPAPLSDQSVEVRALRSEIAQLKFALASNREIAAATGIVMARYLVTQPEAFDMLTRASQKMNRKLHDIALNVLETGLLPGKTYP